MFNKENQVLPNGTFELVYNCPFCGSDEIFYCRNNVHIEAYCDFCDRFIKNVKQYNNEEDWKKAIKERANYTCERCGKHLVGRQAHHKVPVWFKPEWKYRLDNGMCLCTECHKQIHGYGGTIRDEDA